MPWTQPGLGKLVPVTELHVDSRHLQGTLLRDVLSAAQSWVLPVLGQQGGFAGHPVRTVLCVSEQGWRSEAVLVRGPGRFAFSVRPQSVAQGRGVVGETCSLGPQV